MVSRKLGPGKFLVEVGDASIVVEGYSEDFEVRVSRLGRAVPGEGEDLPRYPDLEEAIERGRELLLEEETRGYDE